MAANNHLLEEHQRLSRAWLEAEQERVSVLHKLLQDFGDKCTMDYPENRFQVYREALDRAAATSRTYTQWLAQQGMPAR